jgi:hypothetical protein
MGNSLLQRFLPIVAQKPDEHNWKAFPFYQEKIPCRKPDRDAFHNGFFAV